MESVIRSAQQDDMDCVRTLFREYADWLEFDYCFQAFEQELDGLPGGYAPSRGGLWLAEVGGETAGIASMRALAGDACELKRVWLRQAFRGLGLGRQLVLRSIEAARAADYRTMRLETLSRLAAARRLYAHLGFQEVAANDMVPDVVRLELDLGAIV